MKLGRRLLAMLLLVLCLSGCGTGTPRPVDGTKEAINATKDAGSVLANKYKIEVPEYSLELYNLQRRMYFVNGQFEKANSIPKPIPNMPMGTIVIALNNNVLAQFSVEGKVSSVNSYMSPSYVQKRDMETTIETELPDIDGSYGENDPSAIFFFTPGGDYVEKGNGYIYTSGRIDLDDPNIRIITMEESR